VQALISGFIGQALLVEGGVFRSLRVDRSATPTPASPGDVRNFLARATDAYALEDTQVEQVLEALEAAWEGTAIFNLVQILTSSFEDEDTRSLAAEELDDSLKDQAAVAFAERSLFSAPWPTEITRPANCSSRVAAYLDRLGNVQTAIKSVDRAFGLVDLQLMRLDQEVFRDRFFATSIREGIYRILVLYMTGEASRAEVHFAFDKSLSLKSFKNSREILNGWLKGLGNPERSARPIGTRSTGQREVEENDTPSRSPRISKRRGLDRQKEHERVMSSQTQIESLLKEGKVNWAIENTRALIEEQIRKSGNEFACKTLSSLATSAQELGMHKLQLEWARESLSLNPDDPVAATQVAHAMLKNGAINEALTAYEQVIEQFPGDVVAKTGRAETLRSLGRHAEALTAYDQVIEQFPENVVAKNGRAETLRSLGRHAEALTAYEQVIGQFPENVVAKNGRAETLRSLGRHAEALTAYDQVIEQFPWDVVAKNGRAETLRSLGKYSEALKAYDQVIGQFPENVVAKNGRAETLRSLGKYSEALAAYEQVIEQFPGDVVARAGRAETLRSLGRHAEALTAYDQVIEQFPENVVARAGRAETLRSLGKYSEALAAYEHVIEQFPENAVARTGYVCVLVDQKEYDRALRHIESRLGPSPVPQTQDDWIDFHIRAMIHLKKGDLVAAAQDMQFGSQHCQHPKSKAYFASGLAIVQMRQNAPKDALQTMTKENSFLPVPQLIRGLVLYENLDLQTAMAEIDQLDDRVPFIHEIRDEMKLKYVDKSPISKSTDWFLDQLSNLLLAA
jgi:tetratricopeptide (TPR) repeat protein